MMKTLTKSKTMSKSSYTSIDDLQSVKSIKSSVKNNNTKSNLQETNSQKDQSSILSVRTHYDIKFRPEGSKTIISSSENETNPEKRIVINTLFKDYHECIEKTAKKDEIQVYVGKLDNKISNVNTELQRKQASNEQMSEENLQIIFHTEKIQQQNQIMQRQIPLMKKAIDNLKEQIIAIEKQKGLYELETIKTKEEILQMENKIKKIKVQIQEQIKENAKIKFELDKYKKELNDLKVQSKGPKNDSFIRDIAKLIQAK